MVKNDEANDSREYRLSRHEPYPPDLRIASAKSSS
ncbi:hypothetical protein HNQ91_002311 [Filimonas zeae]|nr:hypothetical protein [Filimonas zeae]